MSTEYGLFTDEGIIEGGFYSLEEAREAINDRYSVEDELEIEEVCPDHRDHARCGCEKCDNEERIKEAYASLDEECDE